MSPHIDYIGALRRRWAVLLACALVGAAAGWGVTLLSPGATRTGPRWEATTILLSNSPSQGQSGLSNVTTLGRLATTGEVLEAVARRIDYRRPARTLAPRINAGAAEGSGGTNKTGLMFITATGPGPAEAKQLADAAARELLRFVAELKNRMQLQQAEVVQDRMEQLEREIEELDRRLAAGGGSDTLRAQRDAKIRQYGLQYEQYQQLASVGVGDSGWTVVQPAQANPAEGVSIAGIHTPSGPAFRIAVAAVFGLLAGCALALLLERVDVRIRTRPDAEHAFERPVAAELPPAGRKVSRRPEIPAAQPVTPTADACRLLAAYLSRQRAEGSAMIPGTILVTSAVAGEGKTYVTANLAAALAEMGRRVLVMSCDFRNPTIHNLLDVRNDFGLAESIEQDGHTIVEPCLQEAMVGGSPILVVPSGKPPARLGEFLASEPMARAIAEARRHAEVVLIDSSPLLVTSDAGMLIPHVDGVLVVARAGRTTFEHAQRSIELLNRLQAPVAGVVLNDAKERVSSRYHRPYYAGAERAGAHGTGEGITR